MNRMDSTKRAQVLSAICEGNSIRSVTRMFHVGKNTVARLLIEAGEACAEYQDKALRNLKCKRVQCDEIWAYIGAKDKNVPADRRDEFGIGSVWTWVALDADSKLCCTWMVGNRDGEAAKEFIKDLASRLSSRIQLTSDGHRAYVEAVEAAFGSEIDYAMLVKIYGADRQDEARYSPADFISCRAVDITGKPDAKHISTSYVERQNLTMRMCMRRFTRLTNGFSKKLENHVAAVSLHFMYYNFVRIHQTLRVTPAMAAGVTDRLWEMSDVVALLDEREKRMGEERETWGLERKGSALGSDPAPRFRH
ncbi:MAG TPA: IS1 family transposase [Bryobacteraceae bacterium]|nr:IS1 family transposase [Bryobacteraceae bacterium]